MSDKKDSWGRNINYKYNYLMNTFYTKDSLFYYLLGAFVTDGNVFFSKEKKNAKVSISSSDLDWLIIINKKVCQENLLTTTKTTNILRMYSKEIASIFVENNCQPNKSLTQKLPTIPDSYLKDFIRGCMDGDGSISIKNKKISRPYKTYFYVRPSCYLCTASEEFANSLSEKLNALKLKHYLICSQQKERKINDRIISSNKKIYRLVFDNKDCVKFLTWIYYPANNISMPRKQKLANQIMNDFHKL